MCYSVQERNNHLIRFLFIYSLELKGIIATSHRNSNLVRHQKGLKKCQNLRKS